MIDILMQSLPGLIDKRQPCCIQQRVKVVQVLLVIRNAGCMPTQLFVCAHHGVHSR